MTNYDICVCRCNGEDNCGNRNDELYNCGTINLYYIFGSSGDSEIGPITAGLWFVIKLVWVVFFIGAILYLFSILFRWCDKRCCGARRDYRRSDYLTEMTGYRTKKNAAQFGTNNSWLDWTQHANRHMRNPSSSSSSSNEGAYPHGAPPPYPGMDNGRSMVHENIYVNNNYGQPQGSTTVHTSPPASNSPLYPKQFPTYGGTQGAY